MVPLIRVLDEAHQDKLRPVAQDSLLVTLAPKIAREDARIDFTQSADRCRCLVHGYNPWPGVTVTLEGDPIKLLRVRALEADGAGKPGEITDSEAGIVRCGAGALQLLEVQPAGKKPMDWRAYIRGRSIRRGQHFVS